MKLNQPASVFAAIFITVALGWSSLAAPPSAWEEVARMGTGINLGNEFDAPDGEGTWWHGKADRAFFEDFKAAGFQHVRLPVTWARHMQATAPYTVDGPFMDRISQVVNWAVQSGLIVVLNAHHEAWFKDDPAGQMERFEALWRQIATRFKDVPDGVLLFEILNESEAKHITAAQTTDLNARILRVIRQTNPTRCVIIGAVGDSADRLAKELEAPNDSHIIATYHCYDPWFFVSGQPRNAAEAKWGSDSQKAAYLRIMDPVKNWSDAHKVPIYLGEWGTSSKCDAKSRLEYYRFVPAQARRHGFSNAIWDDGGDMRVYTRETRQWDMNLLQAVFPALSMPTAP
jgi:endoglucanase